MRQEAPLRGASCANRGRCTLAIAEPPQSRLDAAAAATAWEYERQCFHDALSRGQPNPVNSRLTTVRRAIRFLRSRCVPSLVHMSPVPTPLGPLDRRKDAPTGGSAPSGSAASAFVAQSTTASFVSDWLAGTPGERSPGTVHASACPFHTGDILDDPIRH